MRCRRIYASPIGEWELEADSEALLSVRPGCADPSPVEEGESAILDAAVAWLEDYFSGSPVTPESLPLKFSGSPFQQAIWRLLLRIPYGKFVTYGELAAVYASEHGIPRMSAQAVGGAVGANPLPIIVPCHRVLAAGGRLGGFSGGLRVKRRLLEHEHIDYRE